MSCHLRQLLQSVNLSSCCLSLQPARRMLCALGGNGSQCDEPDFSIPACAVLSGQGVTTAHGKTLFWQLGRAEASQGLASDYGNKAGCTCCGSADIYALSDSGRR